MASHTEDILTATAPEQTENTWPADVPSLASFYMYIAGACNLACSHCWINPTFDPKGVSQQFLKLDHARKLLDDGMALGLRSVKLTGGEPLLHPQFRELVELIRERGLGINIETNGTLIDPPMAQFLKDHGVGFISVSLDGANQQTHDILRNVQGSFEKATRGIRNLVDVGIHPQMICTLHRGNVGEVEDVVALAKDLGCSSVKFNHVQRVGRGAKFGQDHGLDVAEIIHLYKHSQTELSARYNMSIVFDIPMAFRALRDMQTKRHTGCGVHTILGILSSGQLALCGIGVTVPELIFGHVETDDLRDIWFNHPKLRDLRQQIPGELEGTCAECLHKTQCQGHCVAHNYHHTRQLTASSRFCSEADALGLFPTSRKLSLT